MAGLPKRASLLALVLSLLALASWVGVSQDVQTPPTVIEPIFDVQTESTTLQEITDAVSVNPSASDEEVALLIDLFLSAVDEGGMDVSLVGEMLDGVGWDGIDEGISDVMGLIEEILNAYLDELIEDPVAGLVDAFNASLTPDGIVNAVTKAGASPETISEVLSLVASGIPPGIVLRVTKAALRDDDLDVSLALADLAGAFEENPDISPGEAANEATGNGSFKHREREENENTRQNTEENNNKGSNANSKGNKD
ncbi:MAG: hypothetical protein WBC63_07620 [Candidatus Bipolaricaulia bacterium]